MEDESLPISHICEYVYCTVGCNPTQPIVEVGVGVGGGGGGVFYETEILVARDNSNISCFGTWYDRQVWR